MRRMVSGVAAAAGFAVAASALAQDGAGALEMLKRATAPIEFVTDQADEAFTNYATGQPEVHRTETRWRFVCGSDTSGLTSDDLRRIAAEHERQFRDRANVVVIDTPRDGFAARGLFNVIFNVTGGPAGNLDSFAIAEQYLESKFTDNVTITINVSWQNLGGGVIGATGSSFVSNVSWTNSRNALVNGMDATDWIQNSLPTGTSIPVRFTGNAATVTNVTGIDWTRAAYKSTVGTAAGADASMTYNTAFGFDFDPTNGVTGALLSLVDTIVHETGHAMGFVSAADQAAPTRIDTLDIYRFANADGTGTDWNPDTAAEFQTTARVVSRDNPTNDDVNSNLFLSNGTDLQYRMSDGNPWQASHFFMQSTNPAQAIGIMQPALANGVTFAPNYFKPSDLNMIDAIGWDDAQACAPTFTLHPQNTTRYAPQAVTLTAAASGTGVTYQWRRGTLNLPNSGRYTGVTSATLTIDPSVSSDAGSYNVVATNSCGSVTSNNATVTINCRADVDDGTGTGTPDGGVDISDLLFYIALYEAGDVDADIDDGTGTGTPDGGVEISDLLFYLSRYDQGC